MQGELNPATVTQILARWRGGDRGALETLIPHVYDQLHRMARRSLSKERQGHTLSPTALVHEAYLKLVGADGELEDRAHFYAVAARIMRQVLVDHAKARRAEKRGGGAHVRPLEDAEKIVAQQDETLLELDESLVRLRTLNRRAAETIELFYFGGLSYVEMAVALGVSDSTVERDLKFAKAWLFRELKREL
ncbi:MAG: sigma-70 family RNA polymerase sigma factor [Acidobacteria bacterium]|nr:sigma-70 family RNA polymerase sigma factor [Acidobacteriota bacterium]